MMSQTFNPGELETEAKDGSIMSISHLEDLQRKILDVGKQWGAKIRFQGSYLPFQAPL